MHAFPHHYKVSASAANQGEVVLTSGELEPLHTAPPLEFDGPGDRWSPETLLIGAVADCFVLSFRAIARALNLTWSELNCEVNGTLAREQGKSLFVSFAVHASLTVPAGTDQKAIEKALHKAEASCLITNSLSGACELTTDIKTVD